MNGSPVSRTARVVGSNPFTSAAIRVAKPLASNCVIAPTPLRPAVRPSHVSRQVFPSGVTASESGNDDSVVIGSCHRCSNAPAASSSMAASAILKWIFLPVAVIGSSSTKRYARGRL